MNDLLYLTHRIPYPPNKGDKIRSFHLLRGMAKRWNVHLGTFVDDPDDWQHIPVLEDICVETKFVSLNPLMAKGRALRGLVTNTSLTMPYYASDILRRWVHEIADQKNLQFVVAFSSSMAQYVTPSITGSARTVVDFCDIDSDKWRQYSEKSTGIKRWIYAREANKLREEETAIARTLDASVLISNDEASVFCEQTGIPSASVHTVRNGVDTEYFDPELAHSNPYSSGQKAIVFVGAMDYWPNVDAVRWFAKTVFPSVLESNPEAVFYIVGSNPCREVKELENEPGIKVTGTVDDVRPYLRFANCVVAPLRVARGVQNKVLEAMAMARPVIATTMALEGITFDAHSGIRVCDAEQSWTEELHTVLADCGPAGGVPGARRHVTENFSWDVSAQTLAKVVTGA